MKLALAILFVSGLTGCMSIRSPKHPDHAAWVAAWSQAND